MRVTLQAGSARVGLGLVKEESQQRTTTGVGLSGTEDLVVQIQHGSAISG